MENGKELFSALVARLREKQMTLAAAESCTGGWFSKSVVDVAGASEVFLGGVVSYASSLKESLLGVPHGDIVAHTAVSAPVARAMAEGVRRQTGASLGVSVTGLAGPGGGSEQIPVGRVYIAVSHAGGCEVHCLTLPGGRDEVRQAAVCAMAEELIKMLS